ncbi:hypothetical protein ACFVU2_01655 [Leifsonia sp. NPDC058194]|uniref:hypothetical protein n=1 Tax=Leifsonia sp. NPDC058194 TaxID=3346374 RepID=UPI0036DD4799
MSISEPVDSRGEAPVSSEELDVFLRRFWDAILDGRSDVVSEVFAAGATLVTADGEARYGTAEIADYVSRRRDLPQTHPRLELLRAERAGAALFVLAAASSMADERRLTHLVNLGLARFEGEVRCLSCAVTVMSGRWQEAWNRRTRRPSSPLAAGVRGAEESPVVEGANVTRPRFAPRHDLHG